MSTYSSENTLFKTIDTSRGSCYNYVKLMEKEQIMANEFVSILRKPDNDFSATEGSAFRFEEADTKCSDIKYEYVIDEKSAKVIVYPSGSPVKFLKLRFRGDLSFVDSVYGDTWERSGTGCMLEWRTVIASRALPWFCYLKGDDKIMCYGVKTGANCFASWFVDIHGVTLFLNLTNGNNGTDLKEPLVACEIVQLCSQAHEDAYKVAKRFSYMLCDAPALPKEPIFGVNNWYWAYGKISFDSVMSETDYLMRMCKGTKHRPYMIIDDGWQLNRTYDTGAYIGGPWIPNERFGDMEKTAESIHRRGAKAGIWFRPLLTLGNIPEEAKLERFSAGGVILDPSHPYVLERVESDAATLKSWGFDLIKHDFSTMDFFGNSSLGAENSIVAMYKREKAPFDKTKTNAMIIKNLYHAIQNGAGEADVIACNAIGHLCAGIHSVYRTGHDTSGRSFEWTRRYGLNTVMRLPLNDTLYRADPDCAAFTEMVDASPNLDFLEVCALTGMTTLASVTPGILNDEEMKRINNIFLIADKDEDRYRILNYEKTSSPNTFASESGEKMRSFDWERTYDGARIILNWSN